MLKDHKKTLAVTGIVTLLPVLAGLLFWDRLPVRMATHFGINGQADGSSSRAFAVFGLPVFLLAVQLLAAFLTARDPKRQNISPKLFRSMLWIVPAVSLFTAAMIYSYNLGYPVDVPFVCGLFVGAVLVFVGVYLPETKQNHTVGIKLPWTLADEENWDRTHRLAGILWVVCGILAVVLTLCRSRPAWLAAVFAAAVLVPCIYSYWLHVKKEERKP